MRLSKLIAVVGPTASGKTELGIVLAKEFAGEVLACDSRTIYRGMDIGTGKPPEDPGHGSVSHAASIDEATRSIHDLFQDKPRLVQGIPHWGFNLADPDQVFTVAEFRDYADNKILEILSRGRVPILVGGTGLYIRALIDRPTLTNIPPNPALRQELANMSDNELYEEIAHKDPDTAATIDENNRRRLERAVEILRASGQVLAASQTFDEPKYNALQIALAIPRDELYARIDTRVDNMIAQGLVDEVRKLQKQWGSEANALTGIGYRQIIQFFAGQTTLKEAIMRLKYDSHHYAKRQETWFRADPRVRWVKNTKAAIMAAREFLA